MDDMQLQRDLEALRARLRRAPGDEATAWRLGRLDADLHVLRLRLQRARWSHVFGAAWRRQGGTGG